MAKSGFLKVTAPGGLVHIVPENTRKQVEKMNQFAKSPDQKYKISDYDPNNPDADAPETGSYTDVVAKLATDNKAKDKQIADLMKRLEALEEKDNTSKTTAKTPVTPKNK